MKREGTTGSEEGEAGEVSDKEGDRWARLGNGAGIWEHTVT